MATRLERLWVLLDSGSTPVTRKTAAIQIGEIQKLHPHELNNLLKKVCTYLNSKSWETRIAAGQAVEAIAANVKLWDPTFHPKHESALEGEEQREEDQSPPEREELLSLSTFDFKQVLKHGTPLLSSTGDEYQALENDTEFQKMTPQERLSFQRQQLKQRLGLSAQGKVFSTGMENLFDDNDLVTHVVPSMGTGPDNRKGNGNKIRELSVLQLSGMSARERNKAKRKARQMARRASTDTDIGRGECDSPPPVKKPKMASVVVEQSGGPSSNKVLIDQVADVESPFEESEEWPFRWFCEEMFQNLFNPAWEIRHGAGTALREVIKLHGKTAGISIHTLPQNREETNQGWLVDAAVRLLCVFSLDKFADFVSDQVVAPVRATCAQALGIVARLMSRDYVIQVAEVLLLLASESQWEVRHASLMGMQYLLAARKDLSSVLLPSLFPCILRELQDVDDDVRAVAAGALLPVSSDLSTLLPDMVPNLLQSLWDSLLDLDDLSSSTNSIMELMGTLLTSAPTRQTLSIQDPLSADKVHSGSAKMHNLVPRLWPFLSHTICSVRKFSLRALLILLDLNDSRSPSANDMVTVASSNNQEVEVQGGGGWLRMVLQSLLCQLFQRFALEGEEDNRQLLHKVWACVVSKSRSEDLSVCVSPVISAWLCLLVASSSSPVETNLLVPPNNKSQVSSNLYLGGSLGVESHMKKDQAAFMARVAGTKALGLLASKLSSPPPDNSTSVRDASPSEVINILLSGLQRLLSNCLALHKIVAALVVYHWNQCPSESLRSTLLNMLMDATGLEELTPYILAMQKDCQSLIVAFDQKGVDVAGNVNPSGYSAEFATRLATSVYQETVQTLKLSPTEVQEFETLSRNVLTSVGQLQEEHQRLSMRVNSCIAGSLVSLVCLPEKLNPIVRPLMDCIKMEADGVMQQLAASWLSQLVDICQKRVPSPNSKIIKNLCSSACCDPRHTPRVFPPEAKLGGSLPSKAGKRAQTPTLPGNGNQEGSDWKWNRGIISLVKLQKEAQSVTKWSHGRGRLSAAYKEAMATAILEEERRKSVVCQQRGAEMALNSFCKHFGEKLFTALPHLWLQISQSLENLPEDEEDPTSETVSSAQSVINSLQILEIISLSLATPLHSQVLSLLPCLLQGLHSPFTAIRHMAARGMCSLAQVDLHHTMQFVVSEVLPFLETSSSVVHRQGAIEALSCILEGVGLGGLCYVVLFLMPVLGRMSDQDHEVQLMASRCFASLVTLMPLESGATPPPEMSPELVNQRQTDRQFLEQLLDTSKLENYVVPVPIKADLRKYQQDGINWLAFLNKYKLHGILCDDMGLGKTLQSLCLIAGDHHNRSKEYEATGHMNVMPLPSLVICPPTLTGHWFYEVKKFCDPDDLDPLQYSGSPSTRAKLQTLVPKYNLIIASYDIVRNDIDFFKTITWNYCVLDEGHVIKNTKTKITRAVKQLQANHRLILSGTPIQNNVLELWSLFDFLLPGFLGTEKQFYERFGKPIIQSRDAKSSSKEQEAGALAMESLHRQVLPFLLRRMKEDVLQDLPPKIIQDYHCDLSPLQVQLYEDFAKSHAQRKVEEGLSEDVGEEKGEQQGEGVTHIFQALQYLRKVCNHPALVVNPEHPLFSKVQDYLSKDGSNIKDIKHAAKLQALRQLLWDCGIGDVGSDEEEGAGMTAAVSQHRALIFCQYKSMLDIIENTLLKAHMPSVTYLRLDGSIAAANRFEIVNKFNSDPSVDVFLLTTHVGGLGLNLTGADTVIFFEHDWNPMKDLQAMDRAHRIGQKKVVNVYRLITRGTLEEKIMSLQKFKLNIANTVIGQDNSSLRSMNTSDLLDLFQVSGSQQQRKEKNKDGGAEGGGSGGMKKVLENLPELWDDQQYSNEYDLSGFMKSLTAVEK